MFVWTTWWAWDLAPSSARVVSVSSMGAWRAWARAIKRDAYAVYFAAKDPRTPWYAKLLAAVVVAYAFSPIDLIPDFIPVLGHLDDAILVPLGVLLACRLIPDEVLAEHRRQAATGAEQPTDWRIGAVFLAIQGIALAFLVRWILEYFAG